MPQEIKNPLAIGLREKYFPIKRIGNWIILVKIENRHSVCLCDGMYTHWGVIYQDNSIGYDYPEKIPQNIRNWIRDNASKMIENSPLTF